MTLTILPRQPERAGEYVSVRESLANALKELAWPLSMIRAGFLRDLKGDQREAAVVALAPFKDCSDLLVSIANALRDPDLPLSNVYESLEKGCSALIVGLNLLRQVGGIFLGLQRGGHTP